MASTSGESEEHNQAYGSSKVKVTILASEWGSSKGGLSTINRELAIQLANFPEVEITFLVTQCSEQDKKEALAHNINIVEATRRPGYEELDWLSFPPEHLQIDVIVGHGVKLGHQAQVIRESRKCKWVQVVHTDPEELGMFKSYPNPISKAEKKHNVEVELCEMADFVVGVGPKLSEAFRSYLRGCKKDQTILDFTPGVFDEFVSVKQVLEERQQRSILVFGRGDAEDFELKGFDIAAKAVATLPDTHLVFVGAPDGKHEEIAQRLLNCGISAKCLKVRSYVTSRESLKRLFCEVDLVLMPSRTEGFGLTGLEALSAGLPVLVSKNSGFGEALSKVPLGSSFVVDTEDPEVWAAAIRNIWDKERQSRLEEAEALRDCYKRKYSWAKQSKNLLEKMINLVQDAFPVPQSSTQSNMGRFLSVAQASSRPEGMTLNEPHADASYPAHIIERIRLLYKHREERLLPVPWCDDFSFHLNDVFTRLKIVNKEKTRGTLTDQITNMTGIFRAHTGCEKPRIVLIEGEPGMGKTTYCQKLAYDWATKQGEWDQSFPEIEVLLLLRCHDIKSNIWEAIDDQILPDDIDKEAKENFKKFVQENQSKVLLLLDGLDEAEPSKPAIHFKLVESKELPYCHIVATSRHEAGKKVRRYCDTLWEIVGFTKEDAQSFIRKYFRNMEDLAEKLIGKLWDFRFCKKSDQFRDLKELARNPLNTTLLCVLFEDFKGVVPKNRTQLYIEIVLCVLRRYEKKNGLSNNTEDLIGVYKKELSLLGRMALQSLRKGELFFEEHDFGGNFSLLIRFGFLSIQVGGSKRKPCMRCAFLHKSFQEFFAGFYLTCQTLNGEIDCYSVVTDKRYKKDLNQVFWFMCGIIATDYGETTLSVISSIAKHINLLVRTGTSTAKVTSELQFALDCIWECTAIKENLKPQLVSSLGRHLNLQTLDVFKVKHAEEFFGALKANTSLTNLNLRWNIISDTRVASLSQALAANSSLTSLNLSRNSIGATGVASLSQALTVNSSVTNLNVSWNNVFDTGAASLSEALTVNSSLTSLDLSRNSIGATGAACLSQALTANFSLSDLNLSWNIIGDSGAASLSQALKANSSLNHLNLSWNIIGDSGAASLSQALTANSSLNSLDLSRNSISAIGATSLSQVLIANSSLTKLDLSWNDIGNTEAASFFQGLTANCSLTDLNLSCNGIGDTGAASLSQALTANSSLADLNLSSNCIGATGAASLSQALTANGSLTNLNLSGNTIGATGAASLSQGLKANGSLTNLNFSWNNLSDTGVASLSQALTENSSLTNLNLSCNSIGATGAASLSQALTANSSLTNLNLSGNMIGATGAASFSQGLTSNYSLTDLNVSWNNVCDIGAATLSKALAANSSLTSLNLSWNGIGDTGASSLSQGLIENSSLTTLNLSNNYIGATGVASLSQALVNNSSLSSLDLSRNSIGDTGAASLSQALIGNSSLFDLNLCESKISSAGAFSLSEARKINKTVHVIL